MQFSAVMENRVENFALAALRFARSSGWGTKVRCDLVISGFVKQSAQIQLLTSFINLRKWPEKCAAVASDS